MTVKLNGHPRGPHTARECGITHLKKEDLRENERTGRRKGPVGGLGSRCLSNLHRRGSVKEAGPRTFQGER